jgi:hypothetical protein
VAGILISVAGENLGTVVKAIFDLYFINAFFRYRIKMKKILFKAI